MPAIDLTKWTIGSEDAARIGGTTSHTLKNWRVKNGLFKEKAGGRGVPASFHLRDVIKIAVMARMIKLGVPTDIACHQTQGSRLLHSLVTDEPAMLGWRDGKFMRSFDPDADPYLCIPLHGLAKEIVDQLADGIAFKHGKSAAEEAKVKFWRRLQAARAEFQKQQREPTGENTGQTGQDVDGQTARLLAAVGEPPLNMQQMDDEEGKD